MTKITASNYIGREQNPFSETTEYCVAQDMLYYANPKWLEFEDTVKPYPVYNKKGEPVKEYSGEAELMPRPISTHSFETVFIISEPEKMSEPEPGDEKTELYFDGSYYMFSKETNLLLISDDELSRIELDIPEIIKLRDFLNQLPL